MRPNLVRVVLFGGAVTLLAYGLRLAADTFSLWTFVAIFTASLFAIAVAALLVWERQNSSSR